MHKEFTAAVVAATRRLRPGREIGPVITRGQWETVQRYFRIAEQEGATAETGGRVPDEPVLVVIPFDTEDEAVTLANDSEFGLAGGVFTADISRAVRVAEALEAGQVYINSWSTQSVQMPFGGHKNSGYGREKGIEALHHYTHVKSISIRLTGR